MDPEFVKSRLQFHGDRVGKLETILWITIGKIYEHVIYNITLYHTSVVFPI